MAAFKRILAHYGVAGCVGTGNSVTSTVERAPFLTNSIDTCVPGSAPTTTLLTSVEYDTGVPPNRTMTSPGAMPA